jgi:hypothetical protein
MWPGDETADSRNTMSEVALAFLSKRKLHIRRNGATRVLESEFERAVRERIASIQRRHSWKSEGRGAMFTGAWAPQANASNETPVLVTGLAGGPEGGILYSLETDAVSGIFLKDAEDRETRLFHTADFCVRHVALNPEANMLAATAFHKKSMRSNIALLPLHGNELAEVTEGDSFDQLPRWVPGEARRIVFQSAGIGRSAAGQMTVLGPCTIQRLDIDTGDLEEIAAEDGHDLLQPRQTENGTLYYIRKPYESGASNASLASSLKDAALFPLRMALALFQYFNVFSMMYTGKPLVTNNGAVQKRIDPRQAFIHGNLARAQIAQSSEDDAQGTVPSTWQLIRRSPDGQTETVAKNVLTFDVARDGSVVCSDGAAIRIIRPSGDSERVLKGEWIEQVLAL